MRACECVYLTISLSIRTVQCGYKSMKQYRHTAAGQINFWKLRIINSIMDGILADANDEAANTTEHVPNGRKSIVIAKFQWENTFECLAERLAFGERAKSWNVSRKRWTNYLLKRLSQCNILNPSSVSIAFGAHPECLPSTLIATNALVSFNSTPQHTKAHHHSTDVDTDLLAHLHKTPL